MAFQNQPLTDLRVPDTAGLGTPGVYFTNEIPDILAAKYTGPLALAAVAIYYTDSSSVYFYDGITTNLRVRGSVALGVVQEVYRESYNGPTFGTMPHWGTDAARSFFVQFGSSHVDPDDCKFYFQKATLTGDPNSVLHWNGTVRTQGPHTHKGLPYLVGQTGIQNVSAAAVNSVVSTVTFPTAFPAGVQPHVSLTAYTGSGILRPWVLTAYNVSNTQFTLWYRSADGVAQTFTNVPISWSARMQTA